MFWKVERHASALAHEDEGRVEGSTPLTAIRYTSTINTVMLSGPPARFARCTSASPARSCPSTLAICSSDGLVERQPAEVILTRQVFPQELLVTVVRHLVPDHRKTPDSQLARHAANVGDRLDRAPTGLRHRQHEIHAPGCRSSQVFEPGLHVDDDTVVLVQHSIHQE
jgi:hypothetical protein